MKHRKVRPTEINDGPRTTRCRASVRAAYRFWQQQTAAWYQRDAEVAISVFNALNDEYR